MYNGARSGGGKVILNVSGRTDIVAFYTSWFMKRYKEGYVDVINPFQPKLVSRIFFDDVDMILFCTKNPHPILPYLKEISKPMLFHVTLTPYQKDVELYVPDKKQIIQDIQELSQILGRDRVVVRYDPIFLSKKYSLEYHKKAFQKMCEALDGYIDKIIVSFLDEYKNVKKNYSDLLYKEFTEKDYQEIGKSFSKSAREHGMVVQTCFEERNLVEYGFVKGECLAIEEAYQMTGKKYPTWEARKCKCAKMVDIGAYNTCKHFCKYCYANYDEEQVEKNFCHHDLNSSTLVGMIPDDAVIKVRKDLGVTKKEQLSLFD